MFQLLVNGAPLQIGQQLPSVVTSLSIDLPPGILISSDQTPQIRHWVKTLISRIKADYVIINGCITYKDK
jgi:hypothetical protein